MPTFGSIVPSLPDDCKQHPDQPFVKINDSHLSTPLTIIMSKQKQPSFQAQAEQLIKEEALRIAKGTQAPGQNKNQTKLIAKGIEKGIALYKKQEKEKARERAKLRKKRDRRQIGESKDAADSRCSGNEARTAPQHSAALPLAVAGVVFSLVSTAHLIRYFVGAKLILGTFSVPLIWSLPAAAVAALLALWMFRSLRD